MANPFIHYQTKNNAEYASIYTPRWKNGGKYNDIENLGRVIDKQNGIFRSRKRGLFKFTLKDGFIELSNSKYNIFPEKINTLIFGDVYISYKILLQDGYIDLFKNIFTDIYENIAPLILYRLLNNRPNIDAIHWWNGSYAKCLFPNAKLQSARISEYLTEIGSDKIQKKFFEFYLNKLYNINKGCGILLDSTGLPNHINFQETALNNHNGVISNENRLIFVVDRLTKMPIYFRTVAGNIVDVTTLKKTISDLESYNLDIKYSILDAGYYSEDNLKMLFANNINFVTRMVSNRLAYKELVASNYDNIMHMKNRVIYENRLLFIVKNNIKIFNKIIYAFIIIDNQRMNDQLLKLALNATKCEKLTIEELELERKTAGLFVLISSLDMDIQEILPYYYNRQTIEQIFDVCKNNANILPLRCHNYDTYKGHLLLSFLTTITYLLVNNKLKNSKYNAMDAFTILHYLFCDIYIDKISIKEPNKQMKDVMNLLKIDLPAMTPGSAFVPLLG